MPRRGITGRSLAVRPWIMLAAVPFVLLGCWQAVDASRVAASVSLPARGANAGVLLGAGVLVALTTALAARWGRFGMARWLAPLMALGAPLALVLPNRGSSLHRDVLALASLAYLATGVILARRLDGGGGTSHRRGALIPLCAAGALLVALLHDQTARSMAFIGVSAVAASAAAGWLPRPTRRLSSILAAAIVGLALAVAWFRSLPETGGRFFLFINFLEAHRPYAPPRAYLNGLLGGHDGEDPYRVAQPSYAEFFANERPLSARDLDAHRLLYDGEIAYLDHQIGRIVAALRRRNALDDTLVIATSDHGEHFGEHGLIGHQFSVYDDLLRVPLLIRFPRRFAPGAIAEPPVQLLDVFPTICEIAGLEPPPHLQGRSITNHGAPPPIISEYFRPLKFLASFRGLGIPESRFDRRLKAMHVDDLSYIWASDGSDELYDARRDPDQSTNLIATTAETEIERLRSILVAAAGDGDVPAGDGVTLQEGTREALRALGYVP
jgi:hypothetical protein